MNTEITNKSTEAKHVLCGALIKKHWLKIVSRYIFNKYLKDNLNKDGWVSQFKEPNYIRYLPDHNKLFESKAFKIEDFGNDFHIRPLSLKSIT
jgi:hypothetical protein